MSEKIVLIDGHSILNRAFYGLPDLTNSEGMHTNAVFGFLNIMLKILDEEKPEYFVVAFDEHKPTFRHKMFAQYKGTRKKMPDELREQVPVIQEVLEAMGVKLLKQEGLEADDILGTIATLANKQGIGVSLVSGDRDLLQLASDDILIRIPKTKRTGTEIENYHTQEVIDKYGITPAQIIDLKGLMGDSADNIPGVAGIGEKTAVKILTTFPTVEQAYENLEQVEPKRTRELLRAGRDSAMLSKELATIKTDCDLGFSFEEARFGDLFTEEAFGYIKRLELKSLYKYFDQTVVAAVSENFEHFTWISDKKNLDKFVAKVKKDKPSCIGAAYLGDVWMNVGAVSKKSKKKSAGQMCMVFSEDGLDFGIDAREETEYELLGISISYQKAEQAITGVCIVSDQISSSALVSAYREIIDAVGTVLLLDWKNMLHLSMPLYDKQPGVDAPKSHGYPLDTVQEMKQTIAKIKDIEIAAYLLNPMKDTYEAEDIARDYLGMTVSSYPELFGKETRKEVFSKFVDRELTQKEESDLLLYAGVQSYIPLLAWTQVKTKLEEKGMLSLFEEIEMPVAYELFELERLGVQAKKETLAELSKLLESKVLALETDIYDLAGEEFNINSPKQLGVILFEKLKLPFAKKTKTGYSTSADILEKLRYEDPIVDKILEYRQVSKLKSTYADGLAVFIEKDGRIHGKFNQTITATGRISSTEPNLQNIPIRMELGREMRKVFVPKEGWCFLDADYSQIELRLLAHMSDDEAMKSAYQSGKDIHKTTASKVFHTPFEEVTDLQRRNAKAVNFGIVYGISAFGLSQDLNIPQKEAKAIIDDYFTEFPAIKTFLDNLVADAKKCGYVTTLFARQRPIPELSSSNFMQRSFGERVAMNSPIQGTAADIMKLAMLHVAMRLREEELKSRIVLQVHDELLVETAPEEIQQVKQILQEEMQNAAKLSVALEISIEEGKDWFEAH